VGTGFPKKIMLKQERDDDCEGQRRAGNDCSGACGAPAAREGMSQRLFPFFAPHGPVADGSELERCELGWRCLVKECAEDQTMTEFDPNDPLRRAEMRDVRDEGNLATIGLLAVLAIAVMGGIYLWTTGDRTNTAMNTAPGVTTGASKTTPPAAPAPPAKDQGATR
jgi:hypothetical protein